MRTASVDLRSTGMPLAPTTTIKSPVLDLTDPEPCDPCRDIPVDVTNGLGLGFTPPEPHDGLRCQYDAGNYEMGFSCMIAFKTSYGVRQQSLFFSPIYSPDAPHCMQENMMRANRLVPYYKF